MERLIDKVIKGIEICSGITKESSEECPYWKALDMGCKSATCISTMMREARTLLKEQEPKTPIHIHEEYPEHDWETDEDGKIDEWVMDYGFHNGPGCKRCGYSFCMHCNPDGWNEKPCVIDYYQCPKCRKRIHKNSKDIEYCVNCGQAVNWNDLGVL